MRGKRREREGKEEGKEKKEGHKWGGLRGEIKGKRERKRQKIRLIWMIGREGGSGALIINRAMWEVKGKLKVVWIERKQEMEKEIKCRER